MKLHPIPLVRLVRPVRPVRPLLGLLAAFLLLPSACAQTYLQASAPGSTNAPGNSTNVVAQVLFPADDHAPFRLLAYEVTSDLATSKLTLMQGGLWTYLTVAATNATNFTVSATNGFAADDQVVVQHLVNGATYWAQVHSLTGATNTKTINLTAPVTAALAVGDRIYQVTTNAEKNVGAATVREAGVALWIAPAGAPVVIKVVGTNACAIHNFVAARP